MSLENTSFFWSIIAAIATSVITSLGAVWAFGKEIIAPAFKQKFKESLYNDQDIDRWMTEKFLFFIYNNAEFQRWLRDFCRNQFDLENDDLEQEIKDIKERIFSSIYHQKNGVLPKLIRTRARNAKKFDLIKTDLKEINSQFRNQHINNLKIANEMNFIKKVAEAVANYLQYNTKSFARPFNLGSDKNNPNEYSQNLIIELKPDLIILQKSSNEEDSSISYYKDPIQNTMKSAFDSQIPNEEDDDE